MGVINSGRYAGEDPLLINRLMLKDKVYISDIEVLEADQKNTLSAGKAVIGGVLLGPVGAIAGAAIGKKKNILNIEITYSDDTTSIAAIKQSDLNTIKYNMTASKKRLERTTEIKDKLLSIFSR